ncbi:hypothetical protein [Sulfuricurvum sp.]|uniref:hypothetical protein n=1 Tax=Sulfuricurvum sp. TaxID=2025608 RepID=UPI0026165327|nr:hypothetical protein [Sulfuricurvum sp.]MDD2267036.1 hypothetical protein [Sulfuricurvum sp.]MDD2785071.1 hypothetical protein [Sulfuricurvum sp.]
MSTFERVDAIVRQKRYESGCVMRQEQMISNANIEALRKMRAEIEAKIKGA